MQLDRLSIIALDDDRAFLMVLKAVVKRITRWEITLDTFTTWETAKEALLLGHHDLILLDYVLPDVTGLSILHEIRSLGDERPVIILTAHEEREVVVETTKAGAADYLVKGGLTPDTLRRSIQSAMAQFKLKKEKALLTQELNQIHRMETIGTLASGIAHDFNNILTSITSNVELIKAKNRTPEIKEEVLEIESACAQMGEIVTHMLNFSRKKEGKKQTIDVNQSVKEATVVLKHTLPKKIQFQVQLSKDPVYIHARQGILHQIMINLCINASEAMKGDGTIRIHVDRRIPNQEFLSHHPDLHPVPYVTIQVMDTGVGISEPLLTRIFEPFFTTKTLDYKRGTGLSLAVTWQTVKANRGTIVVESTLQIGSRFTVYLPAHQEAPGTDHLSAPPPTSMGQEVLLVDDEELVLRATSKLLQRAGLTIHKASSGRDCLSFYEKEQHKIGVIILDISMPKMNGRECFEELKKIDPSVKVIFSSGHDMVQEAPELLAAGAVDVIQKPYSVQNMVRKIQAILGTNR